MTTGTRLASVGIVVATLLLSGCKPEARSAAVQPQPVQVISIAGTVAEEGWSYTGTIRPRHESDLGFRVAGKITKRMVDIGDVVAKGQVIALLDPSDFRLAVEAQEADLGAALSTRHQAVAEEERYSVLHAKGHVAKAALEQREAAADEARGRVQRAERGLALARNQLAYAALTADQSGVVSALPVEAGQVVAAGQLVARIARLTELEAQVALPEQKLGAVKAATAEAELWGGSQHRVKAVLRELSPDADHVSRTYQARFTLGALPSPPEIGRTVTVHLRSPQTERALAVPLAALMQDGQSPTVWKVDDTGSRVIRVPVTLLRIAKFDAIIAGPLNSGDRIVSLGVHMLDEAKPIRIVEQRAAAQ